jgi:chemotaxis regulatin CheY-phosphate phosphatase CheZ
MKKREDSLPLPLPTLTTGLVACVWHRNQKAANTTAAALRAAEIEYRVEQTAHLLAGIEARAQAALDKVERAEQRFAQLSQSFMLLRQDWQEFLKQQREDEKGLGT